MKFTKHRIALLIWAFISVNLLQPAYAHIYVEAQGTDLEYEIDYSNGTETYEIDPTIIKFGYAGAPTDGVSGALELHLIGESDDQIIDPFNVPFRTDIDTSFGIHGKYGYQGERFGFYLTIGVTILDTTYTRLTDSSSASDDSLLLGGSIGISFRLIENLRLTADYTYATGDASYQPFIGPGDADVALSGVAIGLNYQF